MKLLPSCAISDHSTFDVSAPAQASGRGSPDIALTWHTTATHGQAPPCRRRKLSEPPGSNSAILAPIPKIARSSGCNESVVRARCRRTERDFPAAIRRDVNPGHCCVVALNYSILSDILVDLIGIEPMTSSMPWKRAPSCATGPHAEGCNSPIVSVGASFVKQTTADIVLDAGVGQIERYR